MFTTIQWLPIAENLRDFLKSFRYTDGSRLFECLIDRDDLHIRIGSGALGEWPAIWILFGEEQRPPKQDKTNTGLVQLWIDIYVKGEAGAEIDFDDVCYRQQYQVQKEFFNALRAFQREMTRKGLVLNFQVEDILSDGDEQAPACVQHRIVLNVEWRKENKHKKPY